MPDATTVAITGPLAASLLRAVHGARSRLEADEPVVRHLTQALASAAGVPAAAAPWPSAAPLPEAPVMEAVRTAIGSTTTLNIEHLRQDGSVRTLVVEPYHVRLESGFWYLLARMAADGAERALRLDKVLLARPGEPYQPRPIDLDRYLGGVFVPLESGSVATVRFGSCSAEYAQERWGDGRPVGGGDVEIDIPFRREHFLVRALAESGTDYEVIAPAELRAGVLTRARATLAVYEREAEGA
jgi:predicted DNA-binding transcriptional regulator YafY